MNGSFFFKIWPDREIADALFLSWNTRPSGATPSRRANPTKSPGRGHAWGVVHVTNARWDAVDADAPLTNGAEADGEDVWS